MALTTIEPSSALVVIDLQKGIVPAGADVPAAPVVQRAARLATAFRRHGLPVVLVNVTGRAPGRTTTPAGPAEAAGAVPRFRPGGPTSSTSSTCSRPIT